MKKQGITLTYAELKDELERETNSGTTTAPSGENSKSPLATRSRKRKEMAESQPKPRVYARKVVEGESSKRPKTSGMPTIQEDPLHEGEEIEVEQPKSPPTASITTTIISPLPAS